MSDEKDHSAEGESLSAPVVSSHRKEGATSRSRGSRVWNILAVLVMGTLVAIVGTVCHRSGAAYGFPWGVILALGLLLWSTLIAARKAGGLGVGCHLLVTSLVIWGIASISTPTGSTLVAVGSPAFVTWASRWVGWIWLVGSIVIQIPVFFVTEWFSSRR